MALDWSSVKAEHVTEACNFLLREGGSRGKSHGIYVQFQGQPLPAKAVARIAYARANNLAPESVPKFSSGDGTVKLLQRLGFTVEKREGEKTAGTDS